MWLRRALLALAMVTLGSAADIDPATLLARVQSKVLASAKIIPRYVCRQALERRIYAPLKKSTRTCGTLSDVISLDSAKPDGTIAPVDGGPGYTLIASDRAHLDVMVGDAVELFSWPGGGKFQTNNPDNLLGGGFAGNGDFASFITTAFTSGQTTFEYLGSCGTSCVRYRYDVPAAVSRYVVENPIEKVALGYHGSMDVDPDSANLLAAVVIPTGLADRLRTACDLRTRMTYGQTTMNASQFAIPETVQKDYLSADGGYASNRIRYTGCRQYSAESTLTFGENPSIPAPGGQTVQAETLRPGTTLELRLATSVDSDVSSAGDPVQATLVRAVRARDGGTIPAGTLVSGHLAGVEKTYSPRPDVWLAIRFDTIVIQGKSMPVTLSSTGKMDPRGRGVFTFSRDRVVLDRTFVSRWRVR